VLEKSCCQRRFSVKIAYIPQVKHRRFMQVFLPLELEELVRATIASGVYTSENEVICAALQLLKDHTDYLKEELLRGIEEADSKNFSSMTLEELKAEGRRRQALQNH